jgi:hypothetical protein
MAGRDHSSTTQAASEGEYGLKVRWSSRPDVDESAILGPGTSVWHLAQIPENAHLAATVSWAAARTWAQE